MLVPEAAEVAEAVSTVVVAVVPGPVLPFELLPLLQPQSAKKGERKRRIAGQKGNFDGGMPFSWVRLLVGAGRSLP
jgi:hypothetical protein